MGYLTEILYSQLFCFSWMPCDLSDENLLHFYVVGGSLLTLLGHSPLLLSFLTTTLVSYRAFDARRAVLLTVVSNSGIHGINLHQLWSIRPSLERQYDLESIAGLFFVKQVQNWFILSVVFVMEQYLSPLYHLTKQGFGENKIHLLDPAFVPKNSSMEFTIPTILSGLTKETNISLALCSLLIDLRVPYISKTIDFRLLSLIIYISYISVSKWVIKAIHKDLSVQKTLENFMKSNKGGSGSSRGRALVNMALGARLTLLNDDAHELLKCCKDIPGCPIDCYYELFLGHNIVLLYPFAVLFAFPLNPYLSFQLFECYLLVNLIGAFVLVSWPWYLWNVIQTAKWLGRLAATKEFYGQFLWILFYFFPPILLANVSYVLTFLEVKMFAFVMLMPILLVSIRNCCTAKDLQNKGQARLTRAARDYEGTGFTTAYSLRAANNIFSGQTSLYQDGIRFRPSREQNGSWTDSLSFFADGISYDSQLTLDMWRVDQNVNVADVQDEYQDDYQLKKILPDGSRVFREFTDHKILGEGTSGIVLKAKSKIDQAYYAIKCIKLSAYQTDQGPNEAVVREAKFLRKLKHHNVVRYNFSWCEENEVSVSEEPQKSKLQKRFLCILMEYCGTKTLRCSIDAGLPEDSDLMWRFFNDICEGLNYVHQEGIIHRDLKPKNIFVSFCDTIKIGDFGVATKDKVSSDAVVELSPSICSRDSTVYSQHSLNVGSSFYMAPEILQGKGRGRYDQKADMYSLGVILFEMCYTLSDARVIQKLQDLRGPDIVMPEDFKHTGFKADLVRSLLSHDPDRRPDAGEILQKYLLT